MIKKRLDTAVVEKDVENIYRSELEKALNCVIHSPYKSDGLLVTDN